MAASFPAVLHVFSPMFRAAAAIHCQQCILKYNNMYLVVFQILIWANKSFPKSNLHSTMNGHECGVRGAYFFMYTYLSHFEWILFTNRTSKMERIDCETKGFGHILHNERTNTHHHIQAQLEKVQQATTNNRTNKTNQNLHKQYSSVWHLDGLCERSQRRKKYMQNNNINNSHPPLPNVNVVRRSFP